MRNNMPPTDDCMKNWETMQKLDIQKREYMDKRKRECKDKEEMPDVIPLRRKPEERPTQYRDEKTGLPVAYGKYPPFKFYPTPNNMRHLKNMKNTISSENTSKGEKILEI